MKSDAALIAALLAVALPGCSEPGCDICSTSAVAYGTVTKASAAVSNARVGVMVFRESCTADLLVDSVGTATGTDGGYRVRILTGLGPFTACIRVHVYDVGPPPGPTVTVEGATVRFLDDFGANLKHDSVRVDVAVP